MTVADTARSVPEKRSREQLRNRLIQLADKSSKDKVKSSAELQHGNACTKCSITHIYSNCCLVCVCNTVGLILKLECTVHKNDY